MKRFLPLDFNKNNILFFYIPYLLLFIWLVFSFISMFFIEIKNINDGFVIFSIIFRIIICAAGLYFINLIFIKRNKNKKTYNYFKAFVGYGVIFTYVFYSLPRIVGEFKNNISLEFSILNFLFILIISTFPALLYLLLRIDNTKLTFEISTLKEIEYEKKIKKDKLLKKKEHNKIKSERSFIENLWYEWIDVIVQAIIIAMLIQQFFFQMYQIPSESMVPTFIVKDRVVVNKAIFGPHIPLTEWKLPSFIKPKIGDVVVFKNPEIDYPNSEIKYNNVFSRIFQPFIYMLTLSFVDIDKKNDGRPKERFIVKRLIAGEDEKICIVNDKVYKKTPKYDWKLMSEIEGQKEFGYVDLIKENYSDLNHYMITKEDRNIFIKAEKIIDSETIDSLKKKLIDKKNTFISLLKISTIQQAKLKIKLLKESNNFLNINLSDNINVYFKYIDFFENLLNKSDNNIIYFSNNIYTDLIILNSENPYKKQMKKLNAVFKIELLDFFIKLLANDPGKTILETLDNMNALDTYLDPNYFAIRQFPEYPINENQYINKNEFFMMGDNRYNSQDNRFNGSRASNNDINKEYLDTDDKTDFSKTIYFIWSPRTISIKHVLGKAEVIYFPLNRFKVL